MTTPRIGKRIGGVAAAGAVAMLALTGATASAAPNTSRLEGSFAVKGKITKSVRIEGEKKGQTFSRRWSFEPTCAAGVCNKIRMTRTLKDGSTQKLDLKWNGKQYSVTKNVTQDAKCGSKTRKRGLKSKMVLTVKVTKTTERKGVPVAIQLKGAVNVVHVMTCPGGVVKGYHVSAATGERTDAPAAPVADFDFDYSDGNTVEFFDESEDPDGGKIASWHWDFGDGQTSTERNPVHTYATPGPHTVTLTVVDENDGRSATKSRQVGGGDDGDDFGDDDLGDDFGDDFEE